MYKRYERLGCRERREHLRQAEILRQETRHEIARVFTVGILFHKEQIMSDSSIDQPKSTSTATFAGFIGMLIGAATACCVAIGVWNVIEVKTYRGEITRLTAKNRELTSQRAEAEDGVGASNASRSNGTHRGRTKTEESTAIFKTLFLGQWNEQPPTDPYAYTEKESWNKEIESATHMDNGKFRLVVRYTNGSRIEELQKGDRLLYRAHLDSDPKQYLRFFEQTSFDKTFTPPKVRTDSFHVLDVPEKFIAYVRDGK
jgi:hypothetical protein